MDNMQHNTDEEIEPKRNSFSIKNFLPRSLFGRSLLILIIPVLLIQIFTSYMFFDRHWSKVTTRLAAGVTGEIAMITKYVEENPDEKSILFLFKDAEKYLSFNVTFEKGTALGTKHSIRSLLVWHSMVAQTLMHELTSTLEHPFVLDIDFEEKLIRVSIELENGVLNISLPGHRLFSSSGYIFLLWMLGSSMLLLLIAILFMRNQIRPIRKLAVAAERFGKGRDVPAFKPSGAHEIRQASKAFMDMQQRIGRQIEQRTAMLAGVSHDLRTPLTRLKLQLEMFDNNDDVQAMKDDIQDMQKMLEGYIEFVRGEGNEEISYTDLNLLIDKAVTNIRDPEIEIIKNTDDNIQLMLRPMAIERCLNNLLSNAAKYADKIWISAQKREEKVTLQIEDNGPGVPEDQFEDIFKPFYRVDSSRNSETGGVGLGLPIVMDIVHAHGGKIWLKHSDKGGLKVCISLPI